MSRQLCKNYRAAGLGLWALAALGSLKNFATRSESQEPRAKSRYGTTAIGACQKATLRPFGSSTLTWQS